MGREIREYILIRLINTYSKLSHSCGAYQMRYWLYAVIQSHIRVQGYAQVLRGGGLKCEILENQEKIAHNVFFLRVTCSENIWMLVT